MAVELYRGKSSKVTYQTKTLISSVGNGTATDLTFNNLEIGKTYRLSAQLWILRTTTAQGAKNWSADFELDGVPFLNVHVNNGNFVQEFRRSFHVGKIFVATGTTLTLEVTASIQLQLNNTDTWVQLEEIAQEEVTTWT